jgi:hypothetical protein
MIEGWKRNVRVWRETVVVEGDGHTL